MPNIDREYKIKTSKTVFTILEYLLEEEGASVTKVANNLELSVSTAHNHLKTLESMGYVVNEGGEYQLGLRFLRFGQWVSHRKGEYDMVRSRLDELAQQTQERTQFIVNENCLGVCLAVAGGQHAILTEPAIGSQIYLHASAAGKAIMANLNQQKIDEIIETWGLPPLTENTITNRKELFEELSEIRSKGYALNREENRPGAHAVGVTINYPTGNVVGGLSVIGPTHRLKEEKLQNELPEILLGLKNELELNIEHTVNDGEQFT